MSKLPLNSVGEILRKAREKKRLSLDDVNRHTKISIHVLQALEQDDFEGFESDTYLKGFLKSYANLLQVDMDLISKTLERQRGRVHMGNGTLWDIEEAMTEEKLKSPRIISRLLLPLLILAIIVLSILLVREHRKLESLKQRTKISSLEYQAGHAVAAFRLELGACKTDGKV
jgi:cytoskeleton protein RodZ